MGQFGNVILTLLIHIILSRLLTPEDFGIVGMVQVLVLFFSLITVQGTVPAIIQNKELNEKDYGVLFNYSILLGVFLALVFGASGFLLAIILGNQIYIPISWAMSILIIADAANSVPRGILSKEKRFKDINIRFLLALALGAIVGIASTFFGAGIYALIIVVTVPAITSLFLNLSIANIKHTKSMSLEPVKKIFFFARYQTGFSIINYLYRNLDNLLVGKFLGASALGNYTKSYQLISFPITVILSIVSPVIQPTLSVHEQNTELIRNTYLKACQMLALLAVPVSVFFCLNAEQIVYLLFGSQWTEAIVPFAILSLSIWAQMLAQIIIVFWQSRNLPHILHRNGWISLVIIGVSIVIGILSGTLVGVATAVAISYIVNFFVSSSLLMKLGLNGKITDPLIVLLKPLVLGVFLFVALTLIQPHLLLSNLFLTVLVRGLVWLLLISVYLLISKDYRVIVSFMKKEQKET
ncbi:MAG: lipopolysaccharide biosynthesis protein [Eggerthellaceae bacterium]|nr:lipopolysaccharide biosynthesis protein [Eggerthellaceae bacterium]